MRQNPFTQQRCSLKSFAHQQCSVKSIHATTIFTQVHSRIAQQQYSRQSIRDLNCVICHTDTSWYTQASIHHSDCIICHTDTSWYTQTFIHDSDCIICHTDTSWYTQAPIRARPTGPHDVGGRPNTKVTPQRLLDMFSSSSTYKLGCQRIFRLVCAYLMR